MSVRIRLTRTGKRKEPHYRVVVADQRSPRDGRFIEIIGKYHPLEDPSVIEIDEDRALEWLRKGAQPSDSVAVLLRKVGIWERFQTEKGPTKGSKPSSTKTSTTTTTPTTTPTAETAAS
jgi:small subunit ribosomal protein S16